MRKIIYYGISSDAPSLPSPFLNTIDHAQGNELGDMLEAQNLAEHLAAEDIFAAQRQALLDLEGDLGLLVTGDRDTFEKVLNKIKEYKAYETLKDKIEERYHTLYCRNRRKKYTDQQRAEPPTTPSTRPVVRTPRPLPPPRVPGDASLTL